jgi:hypothetical protein
VPLGGGARTTVHVARYPAAGTDVQVFVLSGEKRLAAWCAARGEREAIVGGFFVRDGGMPLGEVRTHGVERPYVPFDAPWGAMRACVHVQGGTPRILHRDELPARPRGDLLQAGPLLVRDGERVYDRRHDPEGFSAAAHQFDSDITVGRHPRAALGLTDRWIYAVVSDGRARSDAGLTLGELANLLVRLGCRNALNLDGGGSTTMVARMPGDKAVSVRNTPSDGSQRPVPNGIGFRSTAR